MKLKRSFYNRDTLVVSEELLGKTLVHVTEEGITKGKIVEVEAYIGPMDKAAHSYGNRNSARTKIQYGEGGYAYVYLIYGMYICMNIVTNKKDMPEVVLIRALEPLEGIDLMKKRRKTDKIKNLCNGPGKLCQAMGITKENYGDDLCENVLYLEDEIPVPKDCILKTKRINIDYAEEAKDYLWRFSIQDNPYVSK
ncbi:MAG: DNA-3-methyladenine glycosylase [Clostridium sp.]|nr:DNA-3-methyladenine glycosylase [Clostridium sp.]MCM1459187.1 DNA-3-methyladenine glycosylase [Bacteroides sp.]